MYATMPGILLMSASCQGHLSFGKTLILKQLFARAQQCPHIVRTGSAAQVQLEIAALCNRSSAEVSPTHTALKAVQPEYRLHLHYRLSAALFLGL